MAGTAGSNSVESSSQSKGGFLKRGTGKLDRRLCRAFFRLGFFVASHPWKVLFVTLFVVFVPGAGFTRFTSESHNRDDLWVPQGSIAQRNRRIVDANFGSPRRLVQVLFTGTDGADRDDIGTQDAMLDMVRVARAALEASGNPVYPPAGDGTEVKFEERCIKSFDTAGNEYCLTKSPLDLFYDVENIVKADGKPNFLATVEAKINSMTNAQVKRTLTDTDGAKDWTGSSFEADNYIAVHDGKVSGLIYAMIMKNELIAKDGEEIDEQGDEWEKALVTKLIDDRASIGGKATSWFVSTLFTQKAALSKALTEDIFLFAIGILLLVVYVVLFLGEFHVVQSRMFLGLAAILTSGLSILFTYALSPLLGMLYGPLHNVLPLLIIGVGVDDIMMITKALNELDRTNPRFQGKDIPTRVGLALSQAGVAVAVTSLTNFFVFCASSVSRLPGLRSFSIWAAIGILADFFFSVTFFVALLSFDQRRIDARRRDCCACFPQRREAPVREPKEKNWLGKEFGVFHRFFEWFGTFILKPGVRIGLLLFFIALLAVSSWGACHLFLKFRFSFLYPDGTTQKDFQDNLDLRFEEPEPCFVYTTNFDHAAPENQVKLLQMCKAEAGVIATSKWTKAASVDCWYEAMRAEEGLTADSDTFSAAEFPSKLDAFLSGPGKRFEQHIVRDAEQIKIARVPFIYKYAANNGNEIERLETLREDVSAAGLGATTEGADAGENAFPFGFKDIFTERDIALPKEVVTSLGISVTTVGAVTFVLVGHPMVGLICMLVVGFILVNVVGFMHFTGYNLNSVSVISLSVSA